MRCILKAFPLLLVMCLGWPAIAQEKFSYDELREADYMKGKQAFQGRCSACHTLADDSGDIAGPNLWGVFDRIAGKKEGFDYSDAFVESDIKWTPDSLSAFLSDPKGYIPGNIMGIPEPVPAQDQLSMIAFMLIETGAVDWPRPETNFADAQTDASLPYS